MTTRCSSGFERKLFELSLAKFREAMERCTEAKRPIPKEWIEELKLYVNGV